MDNQQKGQSRLKNKIIKDFHSLKDMTVKYANLARKKLDLSNLKKERDKYLVEFAKGLYEKHRYDKLKITGFDNDFKKIDTKTKQIEELEREIERANLKVDDSDLKEESKDENTK